MAATLFNVVSNVIQEDLKPLKKAVGYFKELQSWGPDKEGHSFSFNVAQTPFGRNRYVLVGVFNKLDTRDKTHNPTLIIGLEKDSNTSYEHDFTTRSVWTKKDSSSTERIAQSYDGGGMTFMCKSQGVDDPILDFVRVFMAEHPRYRELQNEAAAKAIGTVAARPLKL